MEKAKSNFKSEISFEWKTRPKERKRKRKKEKENKKRKYENESESEESDPLEDVINIKKPKSKIVEREGDESYYEENYSSLIQKYV